MCARQSEVPIPIRSHPGVARTLSTMRTPSLVVVCALSCVMLAAGRVATARVVRAPQPLPAELHVDVELPGSVANRYLHVTVDIGGGAQWFIGGCVSSARGICHASSRVQLSEAQRREYVQAWFAIRSTPRCEPEGIFPGDREFALRWNGQDVTGHLPADAAQVPVRNAGPCRAHARMAWWVAQAFRAVP